MKEVYLAIDFGGGSGRVMAGYPSGGELQLETIYRFQNRQVRMNGHIYWDFLSLFEDTGRIRGEPVHRTGSLFSCFFPLSPVAQRPLPP